MCEALRACGAAAGELAQGAAEGEGEDQLGGRETRARDSLAGAVAQCLSLPSDQIRARAVDALSRLARAPGGPAATEAALDALQGRARGGGWAAALVELARGERAWALRRKFLALAGELIARPPALSDRVAARAALDRAGLQEVRLSPNGAHSRARGSTHNAARPERRLTAHGGPAGGRFARRCVRRRRWRTPRVGRRRRRLLRSTRWTQRARETRRRRRRSEPRTGSRDWCALSCAGQGPRPPPRGSSGTSSRCRATSSSSTCPVRPRNRAFPRNRCPPRARLPLSPPPSPVRSDGGGGARAAALAAAPRRALGRGGGACGGRGGPRAKGSLSRRALAARQPAHKAAPRSAPAPAPAPAPAASARRTRRPPAPPSPSAAQHQGRPADAAAAAPTAAQHQGRPADAAAPAPTAARHSSAAAAAAAARGAGRRGAAGEAARAALEEGGREPDPRVRVGSAPLAAGL